MAWLYTLFILMLAQVLRSEYTTDNVTVHLQLNSYQYNGGKFEFKAPLFMLLVDDVIGVCEEDYHQRNNGEFKKFNGTPTQNSTAPSSPVIQYSGGKMVYLFPTQEYSKALHLIVKQKYKNRNIVPGEDDAAYYCSNVATDDLVSPFKFTLQSQDCSACSIDVTMVAKCPQHYFNAQCNVYCLPSDDDTSGHYNCGREGEKICLLGYDGENCTINIPDCVNVTCHNGTCNDLVANFSCSCYSGYTGEFCEYNIDDCVEDACENGGKCVDGILNYTCSCAKGFDGLHCEHNIDDCVEDACENGGTCVDDFRNYTCSCANGFNGLQCEHNIYDCGEDACQHGGTCHDGIANYTCSCVDGFDGLHCEHNIDDCVNITCQNGGTCLDDIANYTCSCVKGFDGLHCEHNIDDCVNITCQNGGTCLDGIMNYTCSCVNEFVGINCQLHLTTESTTSQPKLTISEEQHPSTQQTPVTVKQKSSISYKHISPTRKSTVSLPTVSTSSLERTLSTHSRIITTTPKSTSNLERPLSTHSRIITTTPKFNREHSSPTYSSLPPKVDNESSPQKAVAIAPIAGGAAGGVLVLVVVVVLVVKCRGKQPRQESHKSQLQRENTFVSYDSTNGVDLQSNDHHNSLYQQNGQNGTALYHEDEKTQL